MSGIIGPLLIDNSTIKAGAALRTADSRPLTANHIPFKRESGYKEDTIWKIVVRDIGFNSLQTGKGIGKSYQLSVTSFQLKKTVIYLTPLVTDN